jgi:glycosyltransferase involved in cell wall biosynthesis
MLALAIVPPVPVPYREPLFQRLAQRPELKVRVIYQAASQASWDQAAGWFPTDHGYDAEHLRPLHIARRGRSPITWPRGLERALSRFDPDVVVVSEFGPATLRALAWCRLRGRALVVLTEVTGEVERTLSAPQRRVHRLLAREVDGMIAVGGAARRRLLALGAPPERVTVSLQPVDEDALHAALPGGEAAPAAPGGAPAAPGGLPVAPGSPDAPGGLPAAPGSPDAPVEVLTVARLVPDKGIDVLLEAFARAGLGEREARLRIVGGGPLQQELQDRARALGVPASFTGAVGAGELPAHFARASAFVLPSLFEPFGVALREAVVCGLPVICSTAVGAACDLAEAGENAILVAPGDADALADALGRVCRDPALREAMSAASFAVARRHPLQADVDAFAAMVEKAAARRGRGR